MPYPSLCHAAPDERVTQAARLLNPPLASVLLGLLLGASPVGPHLFLGASDSSLPLELQLTVGAPDLGCNRLRACLDAQTAWPRWYPSWPRMTWADTVSVPSGALRPGLEVAASLGSAAGVVQTLVLGASLAALAQPPAQPAAAERSSSSSPPLLPGSRWDQRMLQLTQQSVAPLAPSFTPSMQQQLQGAGGMLTAIAAVRFLLLPVLTLGLLEVVSRVGWLPADPACRLALLIVVSALACPGLQHRDPILKC